MKQYLLAIVLLLALSAPAFAMDATGAKALALKTWGTDGRTEQQFVYIPAEDIWGVRFCVGKQEYYPAMWQPFGFGPIAHPLAGKPLSVNGKEMPTWFGCGSDWNSAFTAAKVPLP